MAGNNGMRPRAGNQTPVTPPANSTETAAGTDEQNTQEAVTETKDTVVIETPTPQPPEVTEEPVVETVEHATASDVSGEDTDLVSQLNRFLTGYEEVANQPGQKPEDFVESASIVQRLTRFVVKTPRQPVLDRLLSFFEENKDGITAERVYLRGVSTLSSTDQQQITYLHTLFSDLATRRASRVNVGQVTQILKKPEIMVYYNRKVAAIAQMG